MRVDEFIPDSMKSILTKNTSNTNVINENQTSGDANGTNSVDFGNILNEKLQEVNDKQIDADNTTNAFIQGDDVDVHKVMLSTEEAKLSLELAVQMRNKLVDAYQELNRTQL
ncbi:flagellar hook-basal body complex protein FliE [Clostridium acetobutylicum]|uniref:Flagellar hook-basal body complex protein FliE n=1 Tax=Clostridium acetobutylicum (strain ATCC 824 / DSM 792 / JCM 1419 / IAM 19013 / LMG 5710 / NBRC 13948 / NRRL B-527 / VKM B-1787 / 2291 / W) TaxID=272562 RepID=FLIE_CLOAB|nr:MULTISPECIES: flagellar hook-basal body complex protein FliE [Clostridium]Q97H50.1 RecName: Full=Flagellar hook-basal body complex protein FliE [Clostridium acetobutylicum ATCC 824]AAK80121.1 Flagellar hook-basal body protein FliE [Clostridium acetobutylicum ATCC 824]ADZ21214.1 flagellar hook-basal body protein FliE [Clostridium acetobutylicum EA 2018]AEI33330.1 flagellar hook-basal body protein FliE [Clostridium acetobutylicum DSM 1731]AWV79454.1 flagellar hook-basal body complex protein F